MTVVSNSTPLIYLAAIPGSLDAGEREAIAFGEEGTLTSRS
jgi:hypothetical protein